MTPAQIIRARTKLGLSQTQFAARVGVSFATVNRWERGHFNPSRHVVRRLIAVIKRANKKESK